MIKCKGEKTLKGAFKDFFQNNKFILLAFLVPFAIMFLVLAIQGFYPFGNKMIMVVDSWHQYYPFLAEYQSMLKEGSSMLYSFNVGGGVNFLGVIANYLSSPLYLLSGIIPSGTPWLPAFLSFTMVVKIGLAGMFFAIMLRKIFRRNDLSLVTFGLMYAFCAYVMGYYWNVMWFDTFAVAPLVIAGVISVLRDKKFSLYIISLALSVIFSFYIGYMVCIFVFLFAVCYTIVSFVSFKNSLKNAGKMVFYTGIAFMLTAFVTVPAFMALRASDSSAAVSGFPMEYSINYGYGYESNSFFNTLMAIVRTSTNLLSFTRPIYMDKGLPNIACGALALILAVFYFVSKKIKLKEKIVSLCLLGFFILSFVINQLNYIWHGMNTPAMVYYRWSFIFSFVLILMAYRAFTLIDSFGKKTFMVAGAVLIAYLGVAFFLQRKLSVGVTAAAAVVIITGFVLYRMGKLKYNILSLLLCLFVVCESGLSMYYGVLVVGYSKNSNYPQNFSQVEELSYVIDEDSKGELVRTEFLEPYTLNDGAAYHLFGISTFNSMCDKSYPDLFAEIGLAASKSNNRYVYFENTPVIDLLLGVKYNIGRDGQTAVDLAHKEVVATTDECTLYENTNYVPIGFMASTKLLDYELHEKAHLPVFGQNDIFSLMTDIDEDVLKIIRPSKELYGEYSELIEEREEFDYYYDVDLKENPVSSGDGETAPLYVEYTIEEDGSYYSMFYGSEADTVKIYVNGDMKNPLEINEEYACIVATGYFEKGDTILAEIPLKNNVNNRVSTYLLKFDEELFQRGYEKLNRDTMTLKEKKNGYIEGVIDVSQQGLFTTSVFYDEGWTAFVDGKEVEITPVAETLIAFELSEGAHTITLKFTPKGLGEGIIISCIGLVAFISLCVVTLIKKKKTGEGSSCEVSAAAKKDAETQAEINLGNSEENKDKLTKIMHR